MNGDHTQYFSGLEALLFVHGEAISKKKIAEALKIPPGDVDNTLRTFGESLRSEGRGLTLIEHKDKVQLVTRPEFSPILEHFVKEEMSEELTPASVEALSLVAYLGPVSKDRIEYFRGVNSSFILRNLMVRGLVERVAIPEEPKAVLYEITPAFLLHLGLTKKEDLPEYEKFRSVLESGAKALSSE